VIRKVAPLDDNQTMNFAQPHLKSLLKATKLGTIQETPAEAEPVEDPIKKINTPLRNAIKARFVSMASPKVQKEAVPVDAAQEAANQKDTKPDRRLNTPVRMAIEAGSSKLKRASVAAPAVEPTKEIHAGPSAALNNELRNAIQSRRKSFSVSKAEAAVAISSTPVKAASPAVATPSSLVRGTMHSPEPIKISMLTPLKKAIESRRKSMTPGPSSARKMKASIEEIKASFLQAILLRRCEAEELAVYASPNAVSDEPAEEPAAETMTADTSPMEVCSVSATPVKLAQTPMTPNSAPMTPKATPSSPVNNLRSEITKILRIQNGSKAKSNFKSLSSSYFVKLSAIDGLVPLRQKSAEFTRVTRAAAVANHIAIPDLPADEDISLMAVDHDNEPSASLVSASVAATCAQIFVDSIACELEQKVYISDSL
jgi:hypothetical protein